MALVVQKYGGSSVATADHIKAVAAKVAERVQSGDRLAVVVSAMGDTTDDLIALAGSVSSTPSPREMDMLLSTGEQTSAALLAMALQDMGISAVSLNAFQLGIATDGRYSDARIVDLDLTGLKERLKTAEVAVITGFQGISPGGDITTLGRGGVGHLRHSHSGQTGGPLRDIQRRRGHIYLRPQDGPGGKEAVPRGLRRNA